MLDSAFTPRWGASSASMPDRGDHHSGSWQEKRLWDDLAPCQSLSKRLSQTFIAVIRWRDKHVPGIPNISKTGHFHPCIEVGKTDQGSTAGAALTFKKAVKRLGTVPKSVETAVTDIHGCDSCVMWCAGYSKHLENWSVSSLHWK